MDLGENGIVSYSLANLETVPFEIDSFSGAIKSTRLIDYESDRRKYRLRIRASDWGAPYRRQTETILTVHLQDINDNRPQFERVNCVGTVSSNVPQGTKVFYLSAVDCVGTVSSNLPQGTEVFHLSAVDLDYCLLQRDSLPSLATNSIFSF